MKRREFLALVGGAAAIACRIPAEGRVTVSDLRSMRVIGVEFLIR